MAAVKLKGLAQPCLAGNSNASTKERSNLDRLAKGLLPYGVQEWPDSSNVLFTQCLMCAQVYHALDNVQEKVEAMASQASLEGPSSPPGVSEALSGSELSIQEEERIMSQDVVLSDSD